jgi:hypothetical protein
MIMLLHAVARSYPRLLPLRDFEPCSWLWKRTRSAFPTARDVVLMPNGMHLVLPAADPSRVQRDLTGVLRGFTRRYGRSQRLFEPVPLPTVVPDALHSWRTSRYVPLNPCRAEYVRDPLEWLWSTYRDVLGATVDPWVTAAELADAHGRSRCGFEETFHRYVSGDPTVAVEGTPLPQPAVTTRLACYPLQRIQLASSAAHRVLASELFRHCQPRRLFVALARDQGWPHAVIANACGLSLRSVRRVEISSAALAAGRLCLGDDRLLSAVDDIKAQRIGLKPANSTLYRQQRTELAALGPIPAAAAQPCPVSAVPGFSRARFQPCTL